MATDSVRGFLDDVVTDLTGLHVKAMQYQNQPHDQAAVDALAQLPAGLIDRAQSLAAQLDKQAEADEKAKAKSAAKR